MAHANARLTEFGRLLLVQRITELGWPPAVAAEALGVSRATAYKWLARYRQFGSAGLADRSSRPHRCPHALTSAQVRRVLAARRRHRQGPHRLAFRAGDDWLDHLWGAAPSWRESAGPLRPGQRRGRPGISVSIPGSWSTSTSRSWAASPTAAATAPMAGRPAPTGLGISPGRSVVRLDAC
jgi:transposase-like protein